MDETLDGKRHPNIKEFVPVPGPGSYNVKSEFDGPK